MTVAEQAVVDAARALLANIDADSDLDAKTSFWDMTGNLRAALSALDAQPDYRERVARLYRGEGEPCPACEGRGLVPSGGPYEDQQQVCGRCRGEGTK